MDIKKNTYVPEALKLSKHVADVFRKHNLENGIASLTCFLDVGRMLPEENLEYQLVEENEKVRTYQLVEWNKIVATFTFSAYFLFNEVKAPDQLEQLRNKDINAEFIKLRELVSKELLSLTFKLDKLTLYSDQPKQANLNIRQSKFYENF